MSIQDRIESLNESDREWVKHEVSQDEVCPDDLYDDFLTASHGDDMVAVAVGGVTLYLGTPAELLKKHDPVAYRCGRNDYINSLLQDEEYIDIEGDLFPPKAVEAALDELDELDEPEPCAETDAFIQPAGTLGSKTAAYFSGDFLGLFPDDESAIEAIRERSKIDQYWPNIWQVSDHGNYHLITN